MPETVTNVPHRHIPLPSDPVGARHLVLKLRWIGHEEEAMALARRFAAMAPDMTLAETPETD